TTAACRLDSPRSLLVDGPSAAELAQQASALEAACDAACVDLYFALTCRQWLDVASLGDRPGRADLLEEAEIYNASLAKLLVTAQRFHRLDPVTGLQVIHAGRPLTIPVERYGFSWTAEDFNELELVGDYRLSKTSKSVRTVGVGVPLVVRRHRSADE